MTDETAIQQFINKNTITWVIMAETWKNNKQFEQTNNSILDIFDHNFAWRHLWKSFSVYDPSELFRY